MSSFASVTVIGYVGSEPEHRATNQGNSVVNFNVAVNENHRGQDTTTWFRCSAWGKLAQNVMNYVSKGDRVLVQGNISASSWRDRNGETRYTLNVRANEVRFLTTRKERLEQSNGAEMVFQ